MVAHKRAQAFLHILGECLVEQERVAVVFLQTKDEVDAVDSAQFHFAGLEGLARATDDVVFMGGMDGRGMLAHIVEFIAGNKLPFQFPAAIAQCSFAFTSTTAVVEDGLPACPSCHASVGDACIGFYVKSFLVAGVDDGR